MPGTAHHGAATAPRRRRRRRRPTLPERVEAAGRRASLVAIAMIVALGAWALLRLLWLVDEIPFPPRRAEDLLGFVIAAPALLIAALWYPRLAVTLAGAILAPAVVIAAAHAVMDFGPELTQFCGASFWRAVPVDPVPAGEIGCYAPRPTPPRLVMLMGAASSTLALAFVLIRWPRAWRYGAGAAPGGPRNPGAPVRGAAGGGRLGATAPSPARRARRPEACGHRPPVWHRQVAEQLPRHRAGRPGRHLRHLVAHPAVTALAPPGEVVRRHRVVSPLPGRAVRVRLVDDEPGGPPGLRVYSYLSASATATREAARAGSSVMSALAP